MERAFNTFCTSKSNRIFLTLQQYMIEIMKVRGTNSYKIPHMKRGSLERKHKLAIKMHCDADLIEDVTNWLNSSENVG